MGLAVNAALTVSNTVPVAIKEKEVSKEASVTKEQVETEKKKVIAKVEVPVPRVVLLEGEVNPFSEASVIQGLEKLNAENDKDPIYLMINSPGGAVFSGAAIITAIEASKAPVNTVCLQICASMAAIIFEYGKERLMVDRSILMFHPASGGLEGEVDKMASRVKFIQRYIGRMEQHIAKRLGLSYTEFKLLVSAELWLDAEDAKNSKATDKVIYLPSISSNLSNTFTNQANSKYYDLKWINDDIILE